MGGRPWWYEETRSGKGRRLDSVARMKGSESHSPMSSMHTVRRSLRILRGRSLAACLLGVISMAACGTGMPVRPGTALEPANLSGWDQRLRVGQEFVLMLADLRNSSDEPITL